MKNKKKKWNRTNLQTIIQENPPNKREISYVYGQELYTTG